VLISKGGYKTFYHTGNKVFFGKGVESVVIFRSIRIRLIKKIEIQRRYLFSGSVFLNTYKVVHSGFQPYEGLDFMLECPKWEYTVHYYSKKKRKETNQKDIYIFMGN